MTCAMGVCAIPGKRSPRTARSAAAMAPTSRRPGRPVNTPHQAGATASRSAEAAICAAKKPHQAAVTPRV